MHTVSGPYTHDCFTGAFFNGVFLLALALSICLQSIERFINIQPVDSPLLVLIMACTGLGLNILSAFVVHGMFLLLLIILFMGNFRFNSEYIYSDHHGHGHGHSHGTPSYELRDVQTQSDPIVSMNPFFFHLSLGSEI